MQPADVAIALRRRSPWEATDLGLTMLQRWWRQVYVPHLLVAVPVMAAALGIAGFLGRAWVGVLVIWWLKPLYDRVVLHVLSRAVFGELPGTRQVFAESGQWLRTGLVPYLLMRWWPDLLRSLKLPVRQLEGQSGRAARERTGVLGRRVGSYAAALTLTCLILEFFVLSGSFGMLAEIFLPAKADDGKTVFEAIFGDGDANAELFSFSDVWAYGAAVLILEPFYVAAGFGLYLNRRTQLEGWDIEVALRRIAQRHVAAWLVLALAFSAVFPLSAEAQEKEPKTEIREVLKAKEFGYFQEVKRWVPRAQDSSRGPDLMWLRALGFALARAGEVALWIGAGALIAYALWWASKMLPQRARAPEEPYRPPAALFGMELAPETLPPDVAAAAAALAREGRLREALGLLYRGALSELVHKRGVRLLASHTEGDALRLAGNLAYLEELIDAWRRCAYAKRLPAPVEVEELVQAYRTVFA